MRRESELFLRIGTNPQELSSRVDGGVLWGLMSQVSRAIELDRQLHPGVMLAQSPEVLVEQYMLGRSCVVVNSGNPRSELVAHGTIWSLCEAGGISVGEVGSVIVLPPYRGQKFSEMVVRGLLTRCRPNDLLLSTTKERRMGKAFLTSGLIPVDFRQYPALCGATCVCQSISDGNCRLRRPPLESTPTVFATDFDGGQKREDTITSCTLFVSDLNLAKGFEEAVKKNE